MFGVAEIRDMQLQAAAKASAEHQHPLVSWPQDSAQDLAAQMPFLGDYVPKGWQLDETYFVDSSGFGSEGEPALTIGQFDAIVQANVGSGWAITEAGQFQVTVGRFSKVKKN